MNCFGTKSSFTLPLLLTSSMLFGDTLCPGNGTLVQYHSLPHSHIGVFAKVNGSGRHEFMVDTGAQMTVIAPALAEELKLEPKGSLRVMTVASNIEVPLVSAAAVEVGGVSAKSIQMAVEELGPLETEYPELRGILGNNFLGRFDFLIDHRHKMLCFDESRRMQGALRGERIPILSKTDPDPSSVSAAPVLVSVHLPDDGREGSILRLDSGSNVPLLYGDRKAKILASTLAGPVRGNTIGAQATFLYAYGPARNVRLGAHREIEIAFASPINGRLYAKPGEDGVLPTALFKRVFISTADHFVMFDPR